MAQKWKNPLYKCVLDFNFAAAKWLLNCQSHCTLVYMSMKVGMNTLNRSSLQYWLPVTKKCPHFEDIEPVHFILCTAYTRISSTYSSAFITTVLQSYAHVFTTIPLGILSSCHSTVSFSPWYRNCLPVHYMTTFSEFAFQLPRCLHVILG